MCQNDRGISSGWLMPVEGSALALMEKAVGTFSLSGLSIDYDFLPYMRFILLHCDHSCSAWPVDSIILYSIFIFQVLGAMLMLCRCNEYCRIHQ